MDIESTSGVMEMINVSSACSGLFVDTINRLYCSYYSILQMVSRKLILLQIGSALITIAGNGSVGSESDMLKNPWGIFVDENFILYVADSGNNRIQRFESGNLTGTTVAGSDAFIAFSLRTPTGVVLDMDGYLFITDTDNNRIVGSSSAGFRCIAGCSGQGGSAANQLNHARSLSFDPFGNILVTDDDNHRIQKFILASNSCSKFIRICFNCSIICW